MDGHGITRRTYLRTWIGLLALSATTLLLSFVPLGMLHLPIALLIAAAKGALILFVFMHLADEHGSIRVAVVVWLLLLAILIVLTAADPATRHVPERPPVSA